MVYLFLLPLFGTFADDPGLGWHLKNGQLILSRWKIPQTDPFLFSLNERQWISDQWLSDAFMALIYDLGSWPLLYASFSLLFIFAIIVPGSLSLLKSGVSPLLVIFPALIAVRLAAIHFILRPVVLSFLAFALLLYQLLKDKSDRPDRGKRYFISYFLLFALWANLHPSFILGLLLVTLFTLTGTKVMQGVLMLGVCVFGSLINPYGLRLHASILQLSSSSFFMNLNSEWKPLVADSAEGLLVLSMIILFTFSLLIQRKRDESFLPLASIVFGSLCFHSIRFMPYFAIIAMPAMALLIWRLSGRTEGTFRRDAATIAFSVFALSLLGFSLIKGSLPFGVASFGPAQDKFPYLCLEKIAAENRGSKVVLTHPDWGGFVTLMSPEENGENLLKPVIDDRNTMLGEQHYKELFEASRSLGGASQYLRKYQVDYILLPGGISWAPNMRGQSDFAAVPCDDFAILLEKRP